MTLFSRVDDFLLLLAERGLIGDLEEIAERFRALAVEPADGEADFVHGLDDLVDLLGEHERRQMDHRRGAHAGADVRRAGGEIAELRVKGEVELAFECGVHLVDHLENALELQPAADAPACAGDPPR